MAKCSKCNASVGCSCNLKNGLCSNCRHKEESEQNKVKLLNTPLNVVHTNSNQ